MPLFCEFVEPDWRKLKEQLSHMQGSGFVFRGQEDSRWHLQSTLERALTEAHYPSEKHREKEQEALFEFQRRAHHYLASPPNDQEELEWLALFRHHGGPTRLVDVTQSPYVAAFFALEAGGAESAAIWVFSQPALNSNSANAMRQQGVLVDGDDPAHEALSDQVIRRRIRGVVTADPKRVNERMAAQQGHFLMQLDVESSFEDNLAAAVGLKSMPEPKRYQKGDTVAFDDGPPSILKYVLPKSIRHEALRDLRFMNITAASLYPGIDGFARSLHTRLRLADF